MIIIIIVIIIMSRRSPRRRSLIKSDFEIGYNFLRLGCMYMYIVAVLTDLLQEPTAYLVGRLSSLTPG